MKVIPFDQRVKLQFSWYINYQGSIILRLSNQGSVLFNADFEIVELGFGSSADFRFFFKLLTVIYSIGHNICNMFA